MCSLCLQFLEDFLATGLPAGLPMARLLRIRALSRVIPELASWFLSLHAKIPKKDFASAQESASRIAKRGRGAIEYDLLIKTSMCNLLKHQHPWIQKEMDIMKVLFVEAGVFQDKERDWKWLLSMSQGYLTYMLPRVYEILSDLHSSHTGGFVPDTPVVVIRIPDDDEDTLYDRDDDYQREILMEVD